MHLPGEQPEFLDLLFDSCRRAGEVLHEHIERLTAGADEYACQVIDIGAGDQCEQVLPRGQLIHLRRGHIDLRLGERIGVVLQPGDWFVIPENAEWPLVYECEEAGQLEVVPAALLEKALESAEVSRQYIQMLLAQNQALTLAYASASRSGPRPAAGFRRFEAGQIIIEQDTPSEEVFTLMRGRARVEIGGVTVGTVREGDIFGVFSALLDSVYTADVIAETDITVMSVPSGQFVELVQAQPETFLRLLRTLSRNIQELNERLLAEVRARQALEQNGPA